MKPSLKHYADYLSIGIYLNVCSYGEIINWVDKLMLEIDHPEDWMIELSTSAYKHPSDVVHLLDSIPGEQNLEISLRLIIAKLGRIYPLLSPENNHFAKPVHSKLLRSLYHLIFDSDSISDELRTAIYQLDIDLDYVEQGYGDWSVIEQDYEKLLTTSLDYQQWL
ncbi:hypothetical protein CLI64_07810 [Nostoc sp. CENA543]|uniref:hypothetical protein n=1 Tax=Nostoc sp. CENA543 TaxID=1869241 RepID=UPI000CA184E7|nr:hypothetical protein [Nostoc sp. CENA543]AUT00296.1 hypothetical protein CLI64_07810 [Nostoc sp. CENA543]